MFGRREVAEVAGRRYWREADARVIVEAWHTSGETASAFAQRLDVDPRRLSRWASRLGTPEPASVQFHPVRVAGDGVSPRGGAAIELELSGGRRIRVPPGFDGEDLRRVLAVLDEGPRC